MSRFLKSSEVPHVQKRGFLSFHAILQALYINTWSVHFLSHDRGHSIDIYLPDFPVVTQCDPADGENKVALARCKILLKVKSYIVRNEAVLEMATYTHKRT